MSDQDGRLAFMKAIAVTLIGFGFGTAATLVGHLSKWFDIGWLWWFGAALLTVGGLLFLRAIGFWLQGDRQMRRHERETAR